MKSSQTVDTSRRGSGLLFSHVWQRTQSHGVECLRAAATWDQRWIKTNELDNWIISTGPLTELIHSVLLWDNFLLLLGRDVYSRILCRLFQMHIYSVSEDSGSCACRIAGPQPRWFSIRQQCDGQYYRPTRSDCLPQVSPRVSFSVSVRYYSMRFNEVTRCSQL